MYRKIYIKILILKLFIINNNIKLMNKINYKKNLSALDKINKIKKKYIFFNKKNIFFLLKKIYFFFILKYKIKKYIKLLYNIFNKNILKKIYIRLILNRYKIYLNIIYLYYYYIYNIFFYTMKEKEDKDINLLINFFYKYNFLNKIYLLYTKKNIMIYIDLLINYIKLKL
jgi:hypothetical protein